MELFGINNIINHNNCVSAVTSVLFKQSNYHYINIIFSYSLDTVCTSKKSKLCIHACVHSFTFVVHSSTSA